jgi:2-keto-4-pentenoate hydratase
VIPLPDRDRYAAGMARQLAAFRDALAAGMPRRGWKVGINVPEVLARLGLRHPGVGWLDGRRVVASGATVAARPPARLHVEPEVCLHVDRAVDASASRDAALACVGAVSAALELVDYAKPRTGLDDVVAHSMFHAGTVVGPRAAVHLPDGVGVRLPRLRVGAATPPSPRRDLVPEHLGDVVLFVAGFLEAFGERLEAGDLVLSGSFVADAVRVAGGDDVAADFGALGTVAVRIG